MSCARKPSAACAICCSRAVAEEVECELKVCDEAAPTSSDAMSVKADKGTSLLFIIITSTRILILLLGLLVAVDNVANEEQSRARRYEEEDDRYARIAKDFEG